MEREHLDAIARAFPRACVVVSTKGEVFASNGRAREALALTDGVALTSIVDSPRELTDYLRMCARSVEPLPGTLRVRATGSGEVVSYACHAGSLLPAGGGNPALVLLRFAKREANDPFLQLNQTIAQLTEEVRRRRDAEERLRVLLEETSTRSEQRFRLLVESVRDYAIFMLDPGGNVVSWNVGAERIKGYKAEEIIGRHFSTFYPPEDVAAGKCEYELVGAAAEGRFEDEGWRVRKDGSRFWANVVITALRDSTGTLIGFAKVTRDLTERKATEDKRRELAVREAAVAEKARVQEFQEGFLAILGHDLRNPLGAIDVGTSILKKLVVARPDDKASVILDRMRASAHRMSRMIEQILDLTRSRLAGGMPVQPVPVELGQMISPVIDELRVAHPSRAIELRCSVPSVGLWDRDRLEQVFSNLVGNAVSYGSPEHPVTIDAREEQGIVRVTVRNGGPPIPDELQDKLFSPFRRGARDSKTTKTAGLGLGLYISYEIVRAHGGRIEVRSSAEQGTEFEVILPLAVPAALQQTTDR